MPITEFRGIHHFLSNFYPAKCEYEGVTYPSSENAYQASKAEPQDRHRFLAISPAQAKHLGRHVKRVGEHDKVSIMKQILHSKFSKSAMKYRLIATGNDSLIEGNTWGDKFWGVCGGIGFNTLGVLLMEERSQITDIGALRRDWAQLPEHVLSKQDGFLDLCQMILAVGPSGVAMRICAYMSCISSLESLHAVVMGERPYFHASQIPLLGSAFAYVGDTPPTATAIVSEWHLNGFDGQLEHVKECNGLVNKGYVFINASPLGMNSDDSRTLIMRNLLLLGLRQLILRLRPEGTILLALGETTASGVMNLLRASVRHEVQLRSYSDYNPAYLSRREAAGSGGSFKLAITPKLLHRFMVEAAHGETDHPQNGT